MIQKELESHLGAGNVHLETFTLAPEAFLNLYPGVFMLFAVLLNLATRRFPGVPPLLTATAALTFSIISPVLLLGEFLLSYELVDPLFRKKQSVNVIGTLRKPGTRHVKRLLIISGHHDSALENTWFRFLGYGFYFLAVTFFIGSIVLLVTNTIQLAGVIASNDRLVGAGTLGWVLLAYPVVPSLIYALFYTRGRKGGGMVPGAVDNLSACAVAVAMCRFLVQNPAYLPDDVEIRFITFGSEEAGLRGSRRYVEHHLDELNRLDVRLLNFEMIAHPEITILTSDINGTVKNSSEMVRSVVTAAERAGVPYKVKPAVLGVATDAGPFTRAGLKATTLMPFKVPQQQVAFYHQKWDRPEVLTIAPLLKVLKLTLEWICTGGECDQSFPAEIGAENG
jgi:hypothetical protein